jgi:hypothetical protein
MNLTFESLDDAAVTRDPLVVLSCGHAFCTSTLDGHMGMSSLYQQAQSPPPPSPPAAGAAAAGALGAAGSGGVALACASRDIDEVLVQWVEALPRDDFPTPKGCPVCRHPIHGVYRYGRLLGLSAAGLMERKHVEACR